MTRLMSFSMTTEAAQQKVKRVTRRMGWWNIRQGDVLEQVEKAQGLKKGEHVKRMHQIMVTACGGEPLEKIADYGPEELIREGFPELTAEQFIEMFLRANPRDRWGNRTHRGTFVNRISFDYYDPETGELS